MLVICPTCKGRGKLKDPTNKTGTIDCMTCRDSGKAGWIRVEELPENYDNYIEDLQLKSVKPTGSMKANL
jgi:hypothetical protein